MTEGGPIVTPGRAQHRAVAAMLARAFAGDPLATHLFPDPAERARRLPAFTAGPLPLAARYGRLRVALDGAGEPAGAAVWLAPGATDVTFARMIRSGMITMPFRIGFGAFGRMMPVSTPLEAAHKRLMPGRHWYLFILGTDPARQGGGVGSALIREGVGWADAEGLPVYLETQNPRNVEWYGRFGFSVAEEIEAGGVRSWVMIRLATGQA